MGPEGNPEATARLRAAPWGLTARCRPVRRSGSAGALRGDLGVSIQYDLPVGRLIASRLPVTLPLAGLAAALHDGRRAAPGTLCGHAPSPRGRLPHHDRLPGGHRRAVVLDRAAPDPALLGAPRLGAVGRIRRMVGRRGGRAALLDAARPGPGGVPGGGARPGHPLGRPRRAPRGLRAHRAGQGPGGAARDRRAHACATPSFPSSRWPASSSDS